MRFNEINGGDILIDDVSIHDLTRENIHDLFCMVLQDTWLFEGSIKENLIYNQDHLLMNKFNKLVRRLDYITSSKRYTMVMTRF